MHSSLSLIHLREDFPDLVVCPIPGYDFDVLAENGFIDFLSSVLGVLAPLNRNDREESSYHHELILVFRSEDISVNFNGTKNVDPAILMAELQNIESLDKIMSLIKVTYIVDGGGLKTETFSGKRLRDVSRLLLTQEGFCFQLSDLLKESLVPLNMKFYFLQTELRGVKVQAEHPRVRLRKFKFYPFPMKGDKIQMIFAGNGFYQRKFTMYFNKGKVASTCYRLLFHIS